MSAKEQILRKLIQEIKEKHINIFKTTENDVKGDIELTDDTISSYLSIITSKYSVKLPITLIPQEKSEPLTLISLLLYIKIFLKKKLKHLQASIKIIKNPSLPKQKVPTFDFSTIPFAEFNSRIKLNSAWLSASIQPAKAFQLACEYMSICKIQVTKEEFKILSKKFKSLPIAPSEVLTYNQIYPLLTDWYQFCHSAQDIRTKLIETINEYEDLRSQLLPVDDKSALDSLISSLRSQLKKIPGKLVESTKHFEEKCNQGLTDIFRFYSKQQFLLGKCPTFENIQKNLEILTIGKFLRFCKDFEIIQGNQNDKSFRKMAKLVQRVFKANSEFNRDMHEHQFVAAVEKIAEVYLDDDYDKLHDTEWKVLGSQEKKIKFFEIMRFDDPLIYGKKMKDSNPHFGVENYSRIPENDLSKRYKYNPEKYKKLKMSVDEWRNQKAEELKQSELLNRGGPKRQHKSTINILEPQKKILETNRVKLNKNKNASVFSGSSKDSQPLTIQRLHEMDAADFTKNQDDFNLKELINISSDDEFLSKYIFKSPPVTQKKEVHKSMSERALARGKELEQENKRSEQIQLERIRKISDSQLGKISAYSKKLRK